MKKIDYYIYTHSVKKIEMIRVGRRIYNFENNTHIDPKYPNFTPIICLTKSTAYGELGPYVLTDEKGRIFENVYQFSKVYEKIPRVFQLMNRFCHSRNVKWAHRGETHVDEDGNLTDNYWAWREKGMNHPHAIRYPAGYGNQHTVLYTLYEYEPKKFVELDYIEARKRIYLPLYKKLVKQQPKFKKLLDKLRNGENLLIIEVDGPHQEDLEYYKTKYDVEDNFIENNTMLITPENIEIMLNDPKHPFGHGYCLAEALFEELYTI